MKTVSAVQHLHLGHLHVEFEDGSVQVFPRGTWEDKDLKVGSKYAVDAPTSEIPAQLGQSFEAEPKTENKAGAAPESSNGPQEEGQQSVEAQD